MTSLHNSSIDIKFYQNRFINKIARYKIAQILELFNYGVFFRCRITYVLYKKGHRKLSAYLVRTFQRDFGGKML